MSSVRHRRDLETAIPYAAVRRTGDLVFLAGVVSWDADGRPIGIGDMAAQLRAVYAEIAELLAAEGLGLRHIVKETVFTTSIAELTGHATVRAAAYAGGSPPASTWVEVKSLIAPDLLVEVEAIAVAD